MMVTVNQREGRTSIFRLFNFLKFAFLFSWFRPQLAHHAHLDATYVTVCMCVHACAQCGTGATCMCSHTTSLLIAQAMFVHSGWGRGGGGHISFTQGGRGMFVYFHFTGPVDGHNHFRPLYLIVAATLSLGLGTPHVFHVRSRRQCS